MNAEFQELRRQWGINSRDRNGIISKMRENLIARNKGNSQFDFAYTTPEHPPVNLSTCDVEELLAVDGDMNPRGL